MAMVGDSRDWWTGIWASHTCIWRLRIASDKGLKRMAETSSGELMRVGVVDATGSAQQRVLRAVAASALTGQRQPSIYICTPSMGSQHHICWAASARGAKGHKRDLDILQRVPYIRKERRRAVFPRW